MECDKLQKLLFHYGIESYKNIEKIDSSHGEDDIRYNYIFDKNMFYE